MKIGFTCGAFDLLHTGHVHFLKQCRNHCDYLIVGLHVDPSIERINKNKPVESLLERQIRLKGCRYVDSIWIYEKEVDLFILLKYLHIDIRFIGSDYKNRQQNITNKDAVPIKIIDSIDIHTTDLRKRLT